MERSQSIQLLATLLALSAPLNGVQAENPPPTPDLHGDVLEDPVYLELNLSQRRLARCVFGKGVISDSKPNQTSASLTLPMERGGSATFTIIDHENPRKNDEFNIAQGDVTYEDDDFNGLLDYVYQNDQALPVSHHQRIFQRLILEALSLCGSSSAQDIANLPEWLRRNDSDGPLLHPAFASPPYVPNPSEIRRQYCPSSNGGPDETILKIIFRNHAKSIVTVNTPQGRCTGYWVGEGLVATNSHCVDNVGGGEITIEWPSRLSDDGFAITHLYQTTGGAYLFFQKQTSLNDVALITTNPQAPGKPLPLLTTLDNPPFAVTIGNPLGTSWTSNAAETILDEGVITVVYGENCVIGPGSSGAPVFDLQARVIGTNFAYDKKRKNYVVPNATLLQLLQDPWVQTVEYPSNPVNECAAGYYDISTPKGDRFYIDPIPDTCRQVRFGKKANKKPHSK